MSIQSGIVLDLEHHYGALKESDAVVLRTVLALGSEPVLSLYYKWDPGSITLKVNS